MKNLKKILLLICIAAFGLNTINAQDAVSPRFTVKTNPLAALGGPIWVTIIPITGEYKVLFEAKTMAKQSVTIGASYLGPSLLLNLDQITADTSSLSGIQTSGFRGQLMYKFFLTREDSPLEGLYLAPHVSYAVASVKDKADPLNKIGVNKLNINALIGYQLISNGGFALDFYTGLGLKTIKWTFEGNSNSIFDFEWKNKNAPAVAFGFSFGYAF